VLGPADPRRALVAIRGGDREYIEQQWCLGLAIQRHIADRERA
jgi:hypothetical protein